MSRTKFFAELMYKHKHSYGYSYPIFDYAPIFERLQLAKSHDTTGKTQIIDLYPTIGSWSLELNEELNSSKHVLMEPHVQFQIALQEMFAYSKKDCWHLSDKNPFLWEAFSDLVGPNKVLSPKTYPRDRLHPELVLTANLAYMRGGVLLGQWLQCILNRNWVQQFGNVRMLIWCYHSAAVKLIPRPGERHRSKSSALADLASDIRLVATTEPKKGQFSDSYFQDYDPLIVEPLHKNRAAKADDFCLLDIKPKDVTYDKIDEWDYVTKQLFTVAASPLSQSVQNLGAGAKEFFEGKVPEELWDKPPSQMKTEDFLFLSDIFSNWPFRPDIYEELLIPSED